jgi:hypothetical protein
VRGRPRGLSHGLLRVVFEIEQLRHLRHVADGRGPALQRREGRTTDASLAFSVDGYVAGLEHGEDQIDQRSPDLLEARLAALLTASLETSLEAARKPSFRPARSPR